MTPDTEASQPECIDISRLVSFATKAQSAGVYGD